jgi:3-oxoadipate CoA-transferase beta subunit
VIKPLTRAQMAWRVAQDIPNGAYVNLGIGLPESVANYLSTDREVVFHCENGVLGMGPVPAAGTEDYDLISAGKRPVTMVTGGAFVHSADSFAMIRGGHIDICVLGAFQVSATGDLANWSTGEPGAVPAVGGAMDLAVGAKRIFVISEHCTKQGAPKIVEHCTYPLTAVGVVSTVYTELAVIDVTADGLSVRESIEGLDFSELQRRTGAPLSRADGWRALVAPALA